MRILHLSMDYPPRHAGGTTVHTYQLAHSLQRLGHEVSVVAASAPGAPSLEDDDGISIHRVRRPYTISSARKARELARDIDVVHGHGICAHGLLKGRHPPTAVKLHNIWSQELEAYRKLPGSAGWRYVNISIPAYVRMDRKTCHRADRLIAISEYIVQGAMSYGIPRDRIDLIRNGVEVERFDDAEPAELGLRRPVVAYIGRLSPHKNVSALVRAFRKIGWGGLLLVGGGPSEAGLRREASPLGDRVRFTGIVPYDEVASYFLAADIIVYPSLYEPLGNVVLEGMASGKPVLASRTGGIPEILPEDAGYLFSTERELEERLGMLMKDPDLRRRMGEAGKDRARRWSWMDVARETADVLERIVDSGE